MTRMDSFWSRVFFRTCLGHQDAASCSPTRPWADQHKPLVQLPARAIAHLSAPASQISAWDVLQRIITRQWWAASRFGCASRMVWGGLGRTKHSSKYVP